MFKKWNKILSFLLAIALVVTTFGSDFANAKVYAIEDAETELVLEQSETVVSEENTTEGNWGIFEYLEVAPEADAGNADAVTGEADGTDDAENSDAPAEDGVADDSEGGDNSDDATASRIG